MKKTFSSKTIQNWIKEGKFDQVKKTKGGHYRVWVDEQTVTILSARVSSAKQKTSLARQERLLQEKYSEARLISDIASGFNQNRRGDKAILESAINGNSQPLVATTSDRITRTGFQLIKWD
ncbi:MAG: recombinase family protein [Thiomargarita sp.]|nr:recombinase family protein [Thiomargarita sp.]